KKRTSPTSSSIRRWSKSFSVGSFHRTESSSATDSGRQDGRPKCRRVFPRLCTSAYGKGITSSDRRLRRNVTGPTRSRDKLPGRKNLIRRPTQAWGRRSYLRAAFG